MKIFFTLFFYFFALFYSFAQNNIKLENVEQKEYHLLPYLEIWANSDSKNIEKAQQADQQKLFKALDIHTFDPNLSSFWLKCTIQNTDFLNDSYILELGNFAEVSIFQCDSAGKLHKKIQTGLKISLKERNIKIGTYIYERLLFLPQKNSIYFYISSQKGINQVESKNFLRRISLKKEIGNFELNYFSDLERVFNILFVGAVGLMLIYHLVLFFFLWDKNYLFYFLHLFFIIFYVFVHRGFFVEWLFPEHNLYRLDLIYYALPWICIFLILFCQTFLKLKLQLLWAYKISWILIFLVALAIPQAFFAMFLLKNYTIFYFIVSFLFCFLTAIILAKRNYKPAYFYVAGNSLFVLGVLVYALVNANEIIESNVYTRNGILLGILAQISLFSLGLAEKFIIGKKKISKIKLAEEQKQKELIEEKNKELERRVLERTEEINQQKEELNTTLQILYAQSSQIKLKNQNIVDSINYALRIQKAILPPIEGFENAFGKDNFFIFYKPKDIVSGDFYYLARKIEKTIISVIDCTGHGVPGAFMTMIARNLLDQIVHDHEIHDPNEILEMMAIYMDKTLKSNEQDKVLDGMDMMVCTFIKKNYEFVQVEYSGAMNPLYYIQNKEFKEIKATKKAIQASEDDTEFALHTVHLFQNEQHIPTYFYLTTDGFQDQFGGIERRKFMSKRFKNLLVAISEKTMAEQHQILNKTLTEWIAEGNEKQTDDITILGFWV